MAAPEDENFYFRRAIVTSTSVQNVANVADLPPALKDGEGGMRGRTHSGEWVKGGNTGSLPHPIAVSTGTTLQQTQVGIYDTAGFAVTGEAFASWAGDRNYQGLASITRGYIVLVDGGGWVNPDEENYENNPTRVTVFHWSPDTNIKPGAVAERGYFS